jgi:tetratricopeptide (TPR) repeat protein
MSVLPRYRSTLLSFSLAAVCGLPLCAQNKNTGASAPPPTIPPTTTGTNPSANQPTSRQVFFLAGRVAFDDGSPLNSNISIQRICGLTTRTEGHTDSKGRFHFQLGNNQGSVDDASIGNIDDQRRGALSPIVSPAPASSLDNSASNPNGAGVSEQALSRCELRAVYPGYRSDSLSLANRKALDNPDVGTLILHRLGGVQGTTISVSSAMAPKSAQKAYEKGMQQASKGDFGAAEAGFVKAVDIYPQYASAWFELGRIRQSQNHFPEAQEAYLRAAKADAKFASPYDRLAQLSAEQGNWPDAITYSGQAISLDPVEIPSSWFYNALGHWSLRQFEEAGKSAQEVLKLDSAHKFPMAELIVASSYAARADYDSELQHLHAYLVLAPEGKNAVKVRQRIADLEQQLASAKK